jgi:hypothetical protein
MKESKSHTVFEGRLWETLVRPNLGDKIKSELTLWKHVMLMQIELTSVQVPVTMDLTDKK